MKKYRVESYYKHYSMMTNNHTLIKTKEYNNALKIINIGLENAKSEIHLKPHFLKNKVRINSKFVNLNNFDKTYIVAIGKSADNMAEYVSKKINFTAGIVIMPQNYKQTFESKKFRFFKSSHPLPNSNSVRAAKYLENFISNTKKNDFIIFLISGGGSALVSHPRCISLKEKRLVNDVLINSGAKINEISCVRKHLSKVKGGILLQKMNCSGVSFVISDVIGDDLSAISSGLTFYDNTTFNQSLKIIKKYKIKNKIPKNVMKVLEMGKKKKITETPKKPLLRNFIVANNKKCLLAMADKAKKMNYSITIVHNLNYDIKKSTKMIVNRLKTTKKSCVIFGGESTVRVIGTGKGGRNQELVLRIVKELKNEKNESIVTSVGTDGIDGNTKYAGAVFSNKKLIDYQSYLKNNNSSGFFNKFGGLIQTGPTHANVNDIGVIITRNL